MPADRNILVVDDDPNLARLLQFALTSEGYSVSVATDGLSALEMALRDRPDLAIVDIGLPELDGIEVCRRLRATPMLADTPVILLTARADTNTKLAGFEAGADEYLVKPVPTEELAARVKALLRRTGAPQGPAVPQARNEGQVWTLFSLKGGVGVSSVAVNLALALRGNWADSTAVLDLNLESPTVESMLNLAPSRGMASRGSLDPEDLDDSMISQLLTPHQSGVEVLAMATSAGQRAAIQSDTVRHILTFLRSSFQYVVVDTASTLDDVNWSALELSDLVMMIVTPDINSWKVGSRALDLLRSLGIPSEKVALVYNHDAPTSALTAQQAGAFFRHPLAGEIPHGGTSFLSSVNLGVPILVNDSKHATAVALRELAQELITGRQQPSPSPERGGVLRWLRGGGARV